MNETRYVQLQLLTQRMSKWEKRLTQIYLKSFYEHYSSTQSVYEKMWAFLEENPDVDYQAFKKSLFAEVSDDGIRKNMERLREKIYESLLLEVNLNRRTEWSASERAKFDSKKLLLKSRMAYSKNIDDTTLYYLDKTLKLARKFELLEDWIEALTLKITFISTRKLKIKFHKLEKERELASYIREKFITSQAIRQEVIMLSSKVSEFKKNKPHIEKLLKEVQSYYSETKSPIIGRQMYYSMLALDELNSDWNSAYRHCRQLSKLIDESPSINNQRELATTRLNMTFFLTLNYKFEDALKAMEGIFKMIDSNGKLYVNALEFKFQNLFYTHDLDGAMKVLARLRAIQSTLVSRELLSRWYYWEACCHFLKQNYKAAQNALFETLEIERDKEGWNLAVRILRILIYIDQNNMDIADIEIENFRRYLLNRDLPERTLLHIEVLKRLRYSGFDFEQTRERMESEGIWTKLQQSPWQPLSPEMILIEDWLITKINGEEYSFQNLKKWKAKENTMG